MGAKEERRGTAERGTGQQDVDEALRQPLKEQAERRRKHATLLDREQIKTEIAESRRRADAAVAARLAAASKLALDEPTVRPPTKSFAEMALEALPPDARLKDGTIPSLPRPDPLPRFGVPLAPRSLTAETGRVAEPGRRGATDRPVASQPVDLTNAWNRVHKNRPPAPPVSTREEWDESNRKLRKLGQISLQAARRIARSTSVKHLRDRGFPIPESLKAETLADLVTSIVYVGPGFAAFFTPDGKLLTTPAGYSAHVAGVYDPRGKHIYGVFLGGADYFVQLAQGPQGVEIGPIQRGRFRINVQAASKVRKNLAAWSDRTTGQLFVISPSYWEENRKGVTSAMKGGPDRLWDAISLSIHGGYVRAALSDAVESFDAWDAVNSAFRFLVDKIIPIPFPGDVEEKTRQGRAIGMAIWGRLNAQSDIDVAARLLAPEIASVVIAKAPRGVAGGVRKGASAARKAKGRKPTSPSSTPATSGSPEASSPLTPAASSAGAPDASSVTREKARGTEDRHGAEAERGKAARPLLTREKARGISDRFAATAPGNGPRQTTIEVPGTGGESGGGGSSGGGRGSRAGGPPTETPPRPQPRQSGGAAGAANRAPTLLDQAARAGVREQIEGQFEVFVHGTGVTAARELIDTEGGSLSSAGGNFGGQFFTVPSAEVARVFARRAATRAGAAEQPAMVGVALPREIADRLRSLRQLQRQAIDNPPAGVSSGATEWVFLPGAIETLQNEGFFFQVQ